HVRCQTCARAKTARMADAGAEGYSVTVAQPAVMPTASPIMNSRSRCASRKENAAAKANSRHAPARTCPNRTVAKAQLGVPNPSETAAIAAAVVPDPSLSASVNRKHTASAMGNELEKSVATYDWATRPRAECGSTPLIRSSGREAATNGNASRTCAGALSE